MHGALQLAALALPLLVVAHGFSCGPLPCGGPCVVVHVVVPAPLVHSLLPAGGRGGPGRERGGGRGGRERERGCDLERRLLSAPRVGGGI